MNKTTPLNNLYCSLRKVGRRIREGSHHIVGHSNVFRLELRSSDNFEIKVFFYLKSLFGKLLPKFRLTNLFAFQKTIQTRLIQTTKIEIRMVIGHIDWSSELETPFIRYYQAPYTRMFVRPYLASSHLDNASGVNRVQILNNLAAVITRQTWSSQDCFKKCQH